MIVKHEVIDESGEKKILLMFEVATNIMNIDPVIAFMKGEDSSLN